MKTTTQRLEVWEGVAFDCDAVVARQLQSRLRGCCQQVNGRTVISRVVGHLQLDSNCRIRIRSPKADGAVVLAWASFCDPSLRALASVTALPLAGTPGDVGSVLAKTFSQQLLKNVARSGLNRQYTKNRQRSLAVRGRIHFPALVRHAGASAAVPCEIWERLPDTPLNRLLGAALHAVERDPMMAGVCKTELLACRGLFDGISRAVPQRILVGRDRLDRLENRFAVTAALARLLLSHGGLEEGSQSHGLGFLVNLESLFERTVARAFSEAGLGCEAQKTLPYGRAPGGGKAHFTADLFCPDLSGEPVVIDAKYKKQISSSNLQQMVTYCVMTGARRGVLVVPAGHGGDTRPYLIPDSLGEIRIEIAELDVTGNTFAEWEANCRDLVRTIRG